MPDCGDKLVHEVQVGLVWDIALSAEDLVVCTLHQLLFQFCSMLDVCFLLHLQATIRGLCSARAPQGNHRDNVHAHLATC